MVVLVVVVVVVVESYFSMISKNKFKMVFNFQKKLKQNKLVVKTEKIWMNII